MKIFYIAFMLLLTNCSNHAAKAVEMLPSTALESADNRQGSVFRIKHKDTIYLISAGHVCDNQAPLKIQGHKVDVLLSRMDEFDLCVLSNNPKIKLPILKVISDTKAPILGVYVDSMRFEEAVGKVVRDIHSGQLAGVQKAHLWTRENVNCDPTTFCESKFYTPNLMLATALAFPGNSGGPVFMLPTREVIGIVSMIDNQYQVGFTPITFVLEAIDNTLLKPLNINEEWKGFQKLSKDFCMSKGITSNPLVVRTGYKSFNTFCRK